MLKMKKKINENRTKQQLHHLHNQNLMMKILQKKKRKIKKKNVQKQRRKKNVKNDDYVYFQLQDERMVFDAMNTLRLRYPNILGISYPNSAYEQSEQGISYTKQKNQTPQEIFGDFFAQYTGHGLDDTQEKILDELVTKIWKEGDEE